MGHMTPRIGLVLGVGGLTGTAFHAGVVAGLADSVGWDARTAQTIVGTSAGSTSAILLRSGLTPADYVARMTGQPLSPAGARVLGSISPIRRPRESGTRGRRPASPELLGALARRPWRFRPALLAAGMLPEGTRAIRDSVDGLAGLFDSWPTLPTWICAVRLDDGRRVVFGRDAAASVGDAVSASCAIPGYFAPVVIDGVRHVDGGVWSAHNADLLAGQHLDVVVVSAPMATDTWHARDAGNVVRTPVRMHLDRELAAVRAAGTKVVVVAPDRRVRAVMGTASMDPRRRGPVAVATRALVLDLADAGRLHALAG